MVLQRQVPSISDFVEECGSPASAVRRDSCGGACDHAVHADHAVDATTDPSNSRYAEDRGRPDCAVRQQSRGNTSDYADENRLLEVVMDIPPELMSDGRAKEILELPMAPWQREMTRVLREGLARRFAEDQTVEVVKNTPQESIPKRTRANRRRSAASRWVD